MVKKIEPHWVHLDSTLGHSDSKNSHIILQMFLCFFVVFFFLSFKGRRQFFRRGDDVDVDHYGLTQYLFYLVSKCTKRY